MTQVSTKQDALKRVLSVASEMLLNEPCEIKVVRIAELARCSTATIYEVYGSKDNLLDDALSRLLLEWPAPIPRLENDDPFASLLSYVKSRIDFLSHHHTRRLLSAIWRRPERARVIAMGLMFRRACYRDLVELVSASIDTGMIRSCDPDNIAYLICSASTYEPIMTANFLDISEPVDSASIIRKILGVLVTDTGQLPLEAYLEKLDSGMRGVSHFPQRGDYRPYRPDNACEAYVRSALISLGIPSPSAYPQ